MPTPENKVPRTSFFLLAAVLLFSPVLFGAVHDVSALSFAALLAFALFLFPSSVRESFSQLPAVFSYAGVSILGWMMIQSFLFAKDPDAARIETLKIGAYSILLGLVLGQPLNRVRALSRWIVGIACLVTLYGFYETVSGHEEVLWRHKDAHQGYVTGTFMNRNHFAGFLELTLGLAVADYLESRTTKKILFRLSSFFVLILLMAGLFASGSRSGILSFFFFSVIFFSFFLKTFSPSGRVFAAGSFAALSAGLIAVAGRAGIARYFDPQEPFAMFQSERWLVWRQTLQLFWKSPWAGIGAGNFESAFPSVQSEKLIFGWTHAHNGYLELLTELGLPAFLVLTAGWLRLFGACLKNGARLEGLRKYELLAVSCGLGAFLFHGISDFNFSIPANMFLFSFVTAYAFLLTRKE